MRLKMIAALSIAAAATALPLAATAHADPDTQFFQSPSGNVYCVIGVNNTGANVAACQVHRYTYAAPPRGGCQLGGWGSQIRLEQGTQPDFECVGGALAVPPIPTLDYGQTHTVGAITCDSEPSGVTCTDSSTGHFFRVSRESYQLG